MQVEATKGCLVINLRIEQNNAAFSLIKSLCPLLEIKGVSLHSIMLMTILLTGERTQPVPYTRV